jgi:hypothetical protein
MEGVFKAVSRELKFMVIHGHFYQAIFRKIQKLGLSKFYCKNPRKRRLCRKLMSLNLLPHRFTRSPFNNHKSQARGALTIGFLIMSKNFGSRIQFGNPKCGHYLILNLNLDLYILLELLWVEADRVPFICFLLTNDKLGTYKKNSLSFTSSLFVLWKNFDQGYYDCRFTPRRPNRHYIRPLHLCP